MVHSIADRDDGVMALSPTDVRDAFIAAVEARLDELRRHDGTYDQTFVRLHVLAHRPD